VGVAQAMTGDGDGWDGLTPDITLPAHSMRQELSIALFRSGFGQDSVTFWRVGVGVECTGTWCVGFPHLSNPLTFSSDLGFAWLKGAGWGIRTCWFDVDRQTSQTLTGTLTLWGVPLVSCWLLAQETKWLLTHPGHPPPLLTHHTNAVWGCLGRDFRATLADLGLPPHKSHLWSKSRNNLAPPPPLAQVWVATL
jgi:hypothetical protein